MDKLSETIIINRDEVKMLLPLLRTGWIVMVKDFKGKKPGNAVNMAWVYHGYSKEGKQQSFISLKDINSPPEPVSESD